jgi:hypothetical protein
MDHPGLGRTTESRWTKELERNSNSKHYHIKVSKFIPRVKPWDIERGGKEKGNYF